MDAVKFLKERQRMFEMAGGNVGEGETTCYGANCEKCAFYLKDEPFCLEDSQDYERMEAKLEEWIAKHPKKTYQQDFLEKYPNAKLFEGGYPMVCFANLGYEEVTGTYCIDTDCKDCWNRSME